jgi:hypothetical protein
MSGIHCLSHTLFTCNVDHHSNYRFGGTFVQKCNVTCQSSIYKLSTNSSNSNCFLSKFLNRISPVCKKNNIWVLEVIEIIMSVLFIVIENIQQRDSEGKHLFDDL